MPLETDIGGAAREFPATHWTAIVAARDGTEARRAALDEVLATYWKPLYTFARRKGLDRERAKDAVQGLFAQLLERDFLEKLDPSRGRLRGFLKAAMDHFLINEHERSAAVKRGGGARVVSLDVEGVEESIAALPQPPDAAFDREWALGVMERATARLKAEFASGKRGGPWELVAQFQGFGEAPAYADAARAHGMSVVQLKAFLHRARVRFRELVREEVGGTIAPGGPADEEIGELMKALAGDHVRS